MVYPILGRLLNDFFCVQCLYLPSLSIGKLHMHPMGLEVEVELIVFVFTFCCSSLSLSLSLSCFGRGGGWDAINHLHISGNNYINPEI